MQEPQQDQTARLDEDDARIGTFVDHSAFADSGVFYPEDETPDGHDPRHDVVVQTAPVPFHRRNRDDAERVRWELMVRLGGAVDDHCLGVLVADGSLPVEDVPADDLAAWVGDAALDVRLATRSTCAIDVIADGEVALLLGPREAHHRHDLELGWARPRVFEMRRDGAIADGFWVVVAESQAVSLTSRLALFYSAHTLGTEEYLGARCELAYAPRLRFHPGAVRLARVRFADVEAWHRAVRAAATASTPRGMLEA
ncbi:hypothetical protein [Nocardioides zeae]|uniref:Uncharacterized protein n=1 Tax=Nocardioides zeae TaxID=1457234 RepID=A0A6P0HMR0_9ACTN|nr:hypothetical protein [Nocardioides zeae]